MRDGWTETTLGDLTSTTRPICYGVLKPGPFVEGGVPLVRITDMDRSLLGPEGMHRISKELDNEFKRSRLKGNEVLLSIQGTVGRVARCAPELVGANISRTIAVIDCDKRLMNEFLAIYLESLASNNSFNSSGSTRDSLNISEIRLIMIPVPPLVEQKRIVDVVSSVDAFIEALQQQVDTARTARNAVLHELLTAGGDDWTETTLGDVADVVMGRQLSPSKRMGTRPRPYLRAANIGNWGISLNDVLEMDFTEAEENQFANRIGDVLMVEGGNEKSVGCPALVTEREVGLCIQNTIIRCRVKDSFHLSPEFLYHFLRYSFWAGKFGELCAGTTIMHLGQKRAVVFPLVLPPLDRQVEIVAIVSSMDDVILSTEQALLDSKNLRSGLLSDLLSGEHEIPTSYDVFVGAA